jgi:hypothetical protein
LDISTLRVKLFCRLLQINLLEEVFDTPSYRLVISALDSKGFDTSKISASTWNDWWHGRRKPNITMRAAINSVTDNLASKWLEPCLVNNRLACHLSSLELGLNDLNNYRQEAQDILEVIHNDWFVDPSGIVSTQNSEPRRRYAPCGQLSELSITLDKGKEAELGELVDQSVISCYDTLNTSSIVTFLLRLGIADYKHEQGLNEAIAVDLASVACAGACILMSDYRYIKNMGKTGRLVMDLFDFWFADEWTVDETHWILSTSLEPILNGWLDLESLINLRKSYRRLIADTGIAISEINKQAKTFNTSLKIC